MVIKRSCLAKARASGASCLEAQSGAKLTPALVWFARALRRVLSQRHSWSVGFPVVLMGETPSVHEVLNDCRFVGLGLPA